MQTFREIVPTLRGNMKKRRKMPRNGWHFPFSFLRHRVRAQKPNSLALRAGVREPNRGPGSISLFSRHKVRAQKPNSLALRAGVREPPRGPGRFFAFFRLRVRARKPSSLALRAGVREPNRGPGHFFCSLADRNRRKGFSYIFRKMFRLGFQKIFCSYSNFSGLCCRNSSEGLFNDFSETFQVRATF